MKNDKDLLSLIRVYFDIHRFHMELLVIGANLDGLESGCEKLQDLILDMFGIPDEHIQNNDIFDPKSFCRDGFRELLYCDEMEDGTIADPPAPEEILKEIRGAMMGGYNEN